MEKALKYRCVREKQALVSVWRQKKEKRIASWGQNFMKFSFVCDLTISFNDILSKKILKLTWENHPWKNKKIFKNQPQTGFDPNVENSITFAQSSVDLWWMDTPTKSQIDGNRSKKNLKEPAEAGWPEGQFPRPLYTPSEKIGNMNESRRKKQSIEY